MRAEYALFLAQVALDFLFIHEHQHVAGGHLAFSTAPCCCMAEVSGTPGVADLFVRHVLEFEADAAATNFSLKIACDRKGNAWRVDNRARPYLMSLRERYEAWLFAIITVFLLVEEATWRASSRGSTAASTHPAPVMMRAFFAIHIFAQLGPFRKPERAVKVGGGILDEVHKAIRAVVDEPPRKHFGLGLLAPSRDEHMRTLGDHWRRMHPRLQELATARGALATPADIMESFIQS